MKSEVLCGGSQAEQCCFRPCFSVQMDFENKRFEKIPVGFKGEEVCFSVVSVFSSCFIPAANKLKTIQEQ